MLKLVAHKNRHLPNRYLSLILLAFMAAFLQAQVPAGYYSTATGTGATLKTQLYNIIKGHTAKTYDYLWTAFYTTDDLPDNKVWDIYSDIPNGTPAYIYTLGSAQQGANYSTEGDSYNREHSFPKSWFNDATPMYTDLFHMYPTDGYVNGMRSDNPYGEVDAPTWTSTNGSKRGPNVYSADYTGTVFEPIDEYKGDLARTYFYMATRYENVIASWSYSVKGNAILDATSFPVYEQWYLDMIYEWHIADPVSQKEIDRNNAIYQIQGNRNPFIDYPEYVYDVWSAVLTNPVEPGTPEPSSYPTNFSARSIQLNWTDAIGAVQPEYYLIRISTTGFNDIAVPTDGVAYTDSTTDRNITAGTQKATISNLNPGTYYIKIFGYTGTDLTTDYKTDGTVPQVTITVP